MPITETDHGCKEEEQKDLYQTVFTTPPFQIIKLIFCVKIPSPCFLNFSITPMYMLVSSKQLMPGYKMNVIVATMTTQNNNDLKLTTSTYTVPYQNIEFY